MNLPSFTYHHQSHIPLHLLKSHEESINHFRFLCRHAISFLLFRFCSCPHNGASDSHLRSSLPPGLEFLLLIIQIRFTSGMALSVTILTILARAYILIGISVMKSSEITRLFLLRLTQLRLLPRPRLLLHLLAQTQRCWLQSLLPLCEPYRSRPFPEETDLPVGSYLSGISA